MSVQAHTNAVLALLAAAPGSPALVVLDGFVPSGTVPPYVLVYVADEDPEETDSRPLEGASERFVARFYVHCVGANAVAARAVAARVRGALLDVVPTISGRSCFPIRREEGNPPERDESTGSLVMDRVDVYRLESVPG